MPAIEDLNRTALMSGITTPSTVESGIEALEFVDRYPTWEAAANLRRGDQSCETANGGDLRS